MSILHPYVLLLLLTVALHSAINANINDFEITCKDEYGNNVDWFYLYKLPNHFGHKNNTKGRTYVYFTSNSPAPKWILSDKSVDDPLSIPGRTLTQAYFDQSKLTNDRLMFAYNDEPPNKKPILIKGHLKGVVVADQKSGFWLVHSVPLYPNITDNPTEYSYPSTGTMYGQSFLCLSLNATQINVVGNQLIVNEPQIFIGKLPNKLTEVYSNFKLLLSRNHGLLNGPFWNEADITTLNNAQFKSFAKGRAFSKELYEDWVAPILNTNLYVETWRKGPGNFRSNCSRSNRVWNVSKVKINKDVEFTTTDDHSKWGVSDNASHWICVGDINRAESQTHRGGGTVCHYSKDISENYRSLVVDFEPCAKPDEH